MNRATYRPASPSDIPAIVEFQIAMAEETEGLNLDLDVCNAGVAAVFEQPQHGRYYVGERDGVVVCSLLITYEWSDWRNGVVWWIQSVYVVPSARNQRIYAGLYACLQDLAKADPRVRGIRLYVDRRNTPAQHVYSQLGMNGEHYRVFEWMKDDSETPH